MRCDAPVRVRLARMVNVLLAAFIAGFGLGSVDVRLLVLVVGPVAWALVRILRLAVLADADGLTVRNPWRTHRIAWREVRRIRSHRTESKTPYLLPSVKVTGRSLGIRVWALAVSVSRLGVVPRDPDPRAMARVAAVLTEWAERYGVAVDASELGVTTPGAARRWPRLRRSG